MHRANLIKLEIKLNEEWERVITSNVNNEGKIEEEVTRRQKNSN